MNIRSVVRPFAIVVGLSIPVLAAYSQDKKIKFGKIDPQDFAKTRFEQDTSAHAVVLADVGTSDFESERDHFELVFKRHRRVKIVDKNGYDAATVEIPLYKSGTSEEKLLNLKAVTYNLENGQVQETKLESKGVFTDQLDKSHILKKFTLPAVKEGSIVEYTYSITSPFYFNLQPWSFQDEYPCLVSDYSVAIPEFYDFIFLSQGYHPFATKDKEESRKTFNFSYDEQGAYGGTTGRTEHSSYTANITTYHWVAKDVPPLKEESFTTSLYNHMTRIEFQLSARKFPNSPVVPVLGTWPKLAEDLNKDEDFGASLDKNNGFLGDVVDGLVAGATSDTAKARRIFNYVRSNFSCTQHTGLYLTKSLKTVFSSHNGSEADINLLLVAMLRRAKLDANPVILSTRRHGYTYSMYPIIGRFNYTIASLNTGEGVYYMDASWPYLGFGRLDASCYNGHARVVSPEIPAIRFDADSLLEQKFTSVFIQSENGVLKGSFQQRPTYFESCGLRGAVKEKGKDEFFKALGKRLPAEVTLSKGEIEDLDNLEGAAMVKFDFEINSNGDEMIYFNPMFTEAERSNPLKSQNRTYPVEMPNVVDEIYTLNIAVPDGYVVEELPKSAVVKFNEDEGVFQYMIQQTEQMIQFRSRIKLNRATFLPEEYNSLRDFYDMIVKKHAEQIVFKKKK